MGELKRGLIFCILTILTISYAQANPDVEAENGNMPSVKEIVIHKSFIRDIGKDFNRDGVYSSDEKALRRAQKSIYVTLPEKRSKWYSTLEQIKEEDKELLPDVRERVIMKRGSISNMRHIRN